MSPAARRTNEPWTCKTLFFFAPALCAGVICDLLCRSEVQTVKNAGCTRRDCSVRRAAGWLFDCVGWVIFPNKQYYFISLLEVRSSTSPRRTHVRTHPILLRRLLRVRVLVQRHLPNLVPHFPIAREQLSSSVSRVPRGGRDDRSPSDESIKSKQQLTWLFGGGGGRDLVGWLVSVQPPVTSEEDARTAPCRLNQDICWVFRGWWWANSRICVRSVRQCVCVCVCLCVCVCGLVCDCHGSVLRVLSVLGRVCACAFHVPFTTP